MRVFSIEVIWRYSHPIIIKIAKMLISSELRSAANADFSTTTRGAFPKSSSSIVSSHRRPIINSSS